MYVLVWIHNIHSLWQHLAKLRLVYKGQLQKQPTMHIKMLNLLKYGPYAITPQRLTGHTPAYFCYRHYSLSAGSCRYGGRYWQGVGLEPARWW